MKKYMVSGESGSSPQVYSSDLDRDEVLTSSWTEMSNDMSKQFFQPPVIPGEELSQAGGGDSRVGGMSNSMVHSDGRPRSDF